MGWFAPFLRSNAMKAFEIMSKKLYELLLDSYVLPYLLTVFPVVWPWISDFERLRNTFLYLLGQIRPEANYEPSATEYYLFYSGTFFTVLRMVFLGWWTWKLFTRARKRTISLVRLAVGEFKNIVIQNLDSHEGENLAGRARVLLTNLDSELLNYERMSVAYCNDQLVYLRNMNRTLAEFKEDENAVIFDHAKACSVIITLREDFFAKNKQCDRMTLSLVRYALQEFNKIVIQDLDSREGVNLAGNARALLRDLDSELLNYERTSVEYCNNQLVHLGNMKRTLAEFREDENARACSVIITSREDFFSKNKQGL